MKYIDSLVKKLVSESLDKKADEIAEKINQKLSGEMEEDWGDYDFEYEEDELTDKARFAKILKRAMEKKGYISKDEPKDKPKNDMEESIVPPAEEFDYVAERECIEGDCGEMEEELHGNQIEIDVAEPKGKITGADFKKLRSMKKESNEGEDGEMEEGNAFTGALAKAKEEGDDSFEVDGKEFKVKNESYSYSISFGKDVLKLTEEEMVSLIEELVLEEKGKSKGMVEYDRVHKKDSDINKDANKASFKKMKDYVKAGSKGSFEENAKDFPKGNGELAKMDKKAYIPSDAVDEYVSDFAYPGMTNLTFDEIKPDDERIKKYLEGDSTTGNSSEYANAVKTEVGEKFFKNYKDNAYGAEQKEASYKRVTAPVDVAGENKGAKSYKTKGQKALDKLSENIETKEKENILSEEMSRMKQMIGYNKKSQ